MYVAESNMHMLSPTGRSRMWDADADGYARGDGVATVVLKKLSDAIADGDDVECIIRETGINQDGRTQGMTVPSSEAQAALIRRTYARAGLDLTNPADRPQFFEAHGTGTKVEILRKQPQSTPPLEDLTVSLCMLGRSRSLLVTRRVLLK
jgi:hybrid polyketide synthase/nonribosomal peptide synthetase ACE1